MADRKKKAGNISLMCYAGSCQLCVGLVNQFVKCEHECHLEGEDNGRER